MSVQEHEHAAAATVVGVAIVTVSDTRGQADDLSGDLIAQLLTANDYQVVSRHHVPDDCTAIQMLVRQLIADDSAGAILLTGGTGFSPRDVTPEALAGIIEKPMPGFGEIFRNLSFGEAKVGPAAILSRATAGTCGKTFIAALPGSPAAVRLAMERLIVPLLRHLVHQLNKPRPKQPAA